jgi:hypothetical protein
MEKSILLHRITPEELKQIIKEVIREELNAKNNLVNQEEDVFLTREETCSILKINKSSLWKWTKKGKLISYGIGNRVLYKKNEVIESVMRIN